MKPPVVTRLVLLDRDGVINVDRADHTLNLKEFEPIAGSLEAIARLSKAGYTVAIATNQSGIGRGWLTETTLAAIHNRLREEVAALGGRIDAIVHAPDVPERATLRRKPGPGMLLELAQHFGVSLAGVPFVGDSAADIEAARAAGATPVLVLTGKGRRTRDQLNPLDVAVHADLASFVDTLLANPDKRDSGP